MHFKYTVPHIKLNIIFVDYWCTLKTNAEVVSKKKQNRPDEKLRSTIDSNTLMEYMFQIINH